jgi:hypothetical protein
LHHRNKLKGDKIMSKADGITRSRRFVESHKGFSIIQVVALKHWYNNYRQCYEMSSKYVIKRGVYYEFCKEGDENRPSCAYASKSNSVAETKEDIDKFLNGDNKGNGDIYYTYEEYQKYVKSPNVKCDYGYGYDSLMKIMCQHQKADKRMKWFLEERLHDSNFHSGSNLLSEGRYGEFEELVTNENPFKEKFEVYTITLKKNIKDPKRLEAHIQSAIEEYFKEHKMDVGDTSVRVSFCEKW